MGTNYAYKYATIRVNNGMCTGMADTSNYILAQTHVPIEDDTVDFFMKYYYPIPEEITCFADWNGLFYLDAAHTQPFDEGNAVLRHDD